MEEVKAPSSATTGTALSTMLEGFTTQDPRSRINSKAESAVSTQLTQDHLTIEDKDEKLFAFTT